MIKRLLAPLLLFSFSAFGQLQTINTPGDFVDTQGLVKLDANFSYLQTQLALKLAAASNLSDLASPSTAKANLGLGNVENTALTTWAGSANITTLGTITTGIWQGTAIGLTFLPTIPMTKLSGILPVANGGTGTATPGIVAGTNVTVTGTWPNQTVNSTASGSSSVTTKGDLQGFSTVAARIPVGADNAVLTADSSQALGVKWATAGAGTNLPLILKSAECINGLASSYALSLPGTNSPIPTCVTGTNVLLGQLNFAAQPTAAQYTYGRSIYLGAVSSVTVTATASAITGTVGFGVQFACEADGATADPAWNTATTSTTTVPGTTLQRFSVALASPVQTGCSTGNEMYFRVYRLINDTATSVAGMLTVRLQ